MQWIGTGMGLPLAALVTPGLLYAGIAGAAVPILIHLLNRRRFRRVRWAAVDFLLQADRENRRRIRVEELILLALRCLAMALVGIVLARWFIRPESLVAALGARGQTERIVLLDDSFSMGLRDQSQAGAGGYASANTIFEQGKTALRELIRTWRESAPDDGLTLLLTSRPDRPMRADLRIAGINTRAFEDELATLTVSARPGNLPAAMNAVRNRVDALPPENNAAVYIVSDFQRIDWLGAEEAGTTGQSPAAVLSGWSEKGHSLQVVLVDVGARANNLAVTALEPQQSQSVATIEGRFTARVANFGTSASAASNLTAYVGDAALPPTPLPAIEPGQTTDVALDVTFPTEGTDVLTVELTADPLPIDNTRTLAVPVARSLQVLIVNGEKSSDPYEDEAFLLTVALQPEGPQFSGNEVSVIDESELESANLAEYHVIVLANVYRVAEPAADRLDAYVRAGGGLAIFLGDQVDAELYNRLLYREGAGLLPARLGEVAACPAESAGWGVGDVDAGHPLTKRLAAVGATLLQRVHVRRCQRCEVREVSTTQAESSSTPSQPASTPDNQAMPARVLMRVDNTDKDPLLIERPMGRGRVILCSSSADKEWNNLPDQPAYVVFAMELVQYLARRPETGGQQLVGSPLVLPFDGDRYQPLAMIKPPSFPADPASRAEPQADTRSGRTAFIWPGTDGPGVYRFELTDLTGGLVSAPFAVNVDTRESDLRRADEAALRATMPGRKVDYVTGRDLAALRDVQVRRELWPLMLSLLVAVLMIEQALGWYFGSGRDLSLLWRGGRR